MKLVLLLVAFVACANALVITPTVARAPSIARAGASATPPTAHNPHHLHSKALAFESDPGHLIIGLACLAHI